QNAGGLKADSGAALVDGGKRHAQQIGIMDIADAYHFDLFGDPNARFQDGLHGAGGGGVVIAENGVRTRFQLQQPPGGFVARSVVSGVDHVGIGRRHAGRGQGFLVSPQPAQPGGDGGAGDVGDPAASTFDQ